MIPAFLKPGDCVGICATARWLTTGQLEHAVGVLEDWGFRVKVCPQVCLQQFQLAGSDAVRRSALQELLDDADCRAILIARGGYGTVRLLDEISWDAFCASPKWICGYSDVTGLLAEALNRGFSCIHSTMPVSFPDCTPEALHALKVAWTGDLKVISWKGHGQPGTAHGKLVGGNLSVLCSLLGSSSALDTEGGVLFLEDVDEMLYHVDRMLVALKRSGAFSAVRGVILGGFTQMKDNTREHGFSVDNPWGRGVWEMVTEHFPGIPVASGFPAGHLSDNRAFYLGREVQLRVEGGHSEIRYV